MGFLLNGVDRCLACEEKRIEHGFNNLQTRKDI